MMRYRLSTVLILLVMPAIVAARVGYLIRWARFHEREAARYRSKLDSDSAALPPAVLQRVRGGMEHRTIEGDFAAIHHHEVLRGLYLRAAYCPWTSVDESKIDTAKLAVPPY